MVVLEVNGREIKFMVDSGATVSCITHKFPLSSESMSISGCVGKPESKPFTVPLEVKSHHHFITLFCIYQTVASLCVAVN
ncbi:unnamed protein product [Knipowitschia caucasica]